MAYLGNDLQVAYQSYQIIDDISSSFNGVLTTFPLQVGGVTPVPFPINPQQCLISVNGVIQEPDPSGTSGFNLIGSNIVFSSAPTGGHAFFGVILAGADYVNIGVKYPSGSESAPSITFDTDLDTGIYNPGDNELGFSTNSIQRLKIDSSGRLLVGTSSSLSNVLEGRVQIVGTGADAYLTLTRFSSSVSAPAGIILGRSKSGTKGTNAAVADGDVLGAVDFTGADGGSSYRSAAQIVAYVDGAVSGGGAADMPGRLVFSTTADGASSPTERMRIDSSGALKASTNGTYKFSNGVSELTHNDTTSTIHLAASSTSFTNDAVSISTYRNTTNDSYKFLACVRQGFAIALEIRDDGDVYNVNGTYGSLSDAKLKENIVDANSQWDDIKCLRVRNYNFKPETNNSTHKQIGVIAQEIEDTCPGLVNTVSDRDEEGNDLGTVTKSVNYSVLYMKAVKALQEAMERIETLEAKVAALESA